jgi:hypothetical protein
MGGCGNHLVKDFLKPLDVGFASSQMMEFWACWVQARHAPDQPSLSDWFPGMNARSAFLGFYDRFGACKGADPFDFETAADAFARGLDAIGKPRLFTHHLFNFLFSSPSLLLIGGKRIIWPKEFARESMDVLERALDRAGWQRRYILLVREPIDIFLSNAERFSNYITRDDTLNQIVEFAAVVDRYRATPVIRTELIRYEDICRRDATALRRVLDSIGLDSLPLEECRTDILHPGEIAKFYSYRRREILALAQRLAPVSRMLGYSDVDLRPVPFLLKSIDKRLTRWRSEKIVFDRVFAGDFSAPATVFNHKRSTLAKIYWQLNMLVPGKRRHYEAFYRAATGAEMPTPRFERPFRRAFGLRITE